MSCKPSSNLKSSSDQTTRLVFFHLDSTSKYLFSIGFHTVARILCIAVTLLVIPELSKHSPNHLNPFCFVYFTLVYCKCSCCLCNSFFFFLSSRCPAAADRSPNSDWLSGNLLDCPHLLDQCRHYAHKYAHTQTNKRLQFNTMECVHLTWSGY